MNTGNPSHVAHPMFPTAHTPMFMSSGGVKKYTVCKNTLLHTTNVPFFLVNNNGIGSSNLNMANEPSMYMSSYGGEMPNHMPARNSCGRNVQETPWSAPFETQEHIGNITTMHEVNPLHVAHPIFHTAQNQVVVSSSKF